MSEPNPNSLGNVHVTGAHLLECFWNLVETSYHESPRAFTRDDLEGFVQNSGRRKAVVKKVRMELERYYTKDALGDYIRDTAGYVLLALAEATKLQGKGFQWKAPVPARAKKILTWLLKIIGEEEFRNCIVHAGQDGIIRILERDAPAAEKPLVDEPLQLLVSIDSSTTNRSAFDTEFAISVSKHIEELGFTSVVQNGVWCNSFENRTSLSTSIVAVLRAIDAAHVGRFRQLVVAFHYSDPSDEPMLRGIDCIRDIARVRFEKYAASMPPDERAATVVLASQSLQRLLQHRFSFEPVGELGIRAATLRPVVYQIWAQIPRWSLAHVPEAVENALRSDERVVEVNVRDAMCDQDLQQVSRAILFQLEDSLPSGSLILHWQCTPERNSDLLRPFDECLGALAGLCRRCSFESDGSGVDRPIDVRDVVERFLDEHVGKERAAGIRNSILALLVGGRSDDDFRSVLKDISKFIEGMLVGRTVRIVVENAQHADRLLTSLIQQLPDLPRKVRDAFQLYMVSRDESFNLLEMPSDFQLPWFESLEDDAQSLLHIAAILGSDFRWSWLEDIWSSGDSTHVRFVEALDSCLRAGIIQYCDSLIDGHSSNTFHRQMKWVQRQQHEDVQCILRIRHLDRITEIVRRFWERTKKELDEKNGEVACLRMKTRIFDILTTFRHIGSADPRIMTKLGMFLAKRAFMADAFQEASRRIDATLIWHRQIQDIHEIDVEDRRAIAEQQTKLIKQERGRPDPFPWSERSFPQVTLKEIPEKARSDKLRAKEWFVLARLVWAEELWSGSLAVADRYAHLMKDLASRCDEALASEACHALAVTQFSLGKFNECLYVSTRVVEFCEKTESIQHTDSDCFGSHDGRVCGKLFRAITELLLNGRDNDEWLRKGNTYADAHGNAETKQIANSYTVLFSILCEEYHDALNRGKRYLKLTTSRQWELLRDLLAVCAGIAVEFREETFGSKKLLDELEFLRKRWGIQEYDTLWLAFVGVARWNASHDYSVASLSFEMSKAVSCQRGENAFIPFVYLWWGRIALADGRRDLALELWLTGKGWAESMRAVHYQFLLFREMSTCPN